MARNKQRKHTFFVYGKITNWLPTFNGGMLLLEFLSLLPILNVTAVNMEKNRFLGKGSDIPEAVRCYDDYGCFSIRDPWLSFDRPVSNFPQSYEEINPRLCLHGLSNECHILKSVEHLQSSPFNPRLPVIFITHGYNGGTTDRWIQKSVKGLLGHGSYNVITLDWSQGFGRGYEQTIANARLMGSVIAHQILLIQAVHNLTGDAFHLIGHNVGSHIMGYAGKRIKEKGGYIGRITGLDPARLYFEGGKAEVRLHPDDAIFVDVIYTDPVITKGNTEIADFGKLQFFAVTPDIKSCYGNQVRPTHACTGSLAGDLFATSIHGGCSFTSYQCSSYENFRHSRCKSCGKDGSLCVSMGLKATDDISKLDKARKQFVFVQEPGDICGETLQVVLISKPTSRYQNMMSGYLTIKLASKSGSQTSYSTDITLTPGKLATFIMPIPKGFDVSTASLHLTREVGLLYFLIPGSNDIILNRIILQNLETKNRWVLCAYDKSLSSPSSIYATVDDSCPSYDNIDQHTLRNILSLESTKFNLDAFVPVIKRTPFYY